MGRLLLLALVSGLLVSSASFLQAGDDAKSLQGVWLAQSLEADGKAAPADVIKKMKFTFKGEKLLVAGNNGDDKEEDCAYKIDAKKSPKHLDFTPPNEPKALVGIYEVKGDELKICLRHGSSTEGRPTEFKTSAGSKLVLIVLKRQK